MVLFPQYLWPSEVKSLKNHKYVSSHPTLVDKLLNPWWELVAKCIPSFVAPNVVTIMGLVCSLVGAGCALYNSPSLESGCPSWVWCVAAGGFFLHQTLDCVDGKHARKLGVSSPLGQLLDHGCDAFTMCCLGIGCIVAGRYGYTTLSFWILGALMANGFIWAWGDIHTGKFSTSFGTFGVTEGQLFSIFVCLLPLFADGVDLLPYLPSAVSRPLKYQYLPYFFGGQTKLFWPDVIAPTWILLETIIVLGSSIRTLSKAKDKTEAIGHLLGFGTFLYCAHAFWKHGGAKYNAAWCIVIIALYYCIIFLRAIVSATCKVKYAPFQWPVFPLFAAAIVLCDCFPLASYLKEYHIKELDFKFHLFSFLTGWACLYLCDFIYTTIHTICKSLDIPFWTVKSKTTKTKTKRT